MMRRTRLSLWYPASYLLGTGLGLLAAPQLVFRMMFSTGSYDSVTPRMAGALMLTLGILVVQIIRHRVEALYSTVAGVRVLLCAIWLWLYRYSGDRFFLLVFAVVALGFVWTTVALRLDRARPAP